MFGFLKKKVKSAIASITDRFEAEGEEGTEEPENDQNPESEQP